MIELWAEVFDASYTTQITNGIVPLVAADVERVLDGIGRVTMLTTPLHRDFSKRPIELLTGKRVCEIWYREAPEDKRKVGTCVIEQVGFVTSQDAIHLQILGRDTLSLLNNFVTGQGLTFDNVSNAVALDSLTDIAGWTQTFNGSQGNVTMRFDGATVFKSIQALGESTGNHFRLTDTYKELEWGVLGDDSGYRLVKIEGDKPGPDRNPDVIPIETIDINDDSSQIVNKIYPLSGGNGDSRGTLEASTETSPYTIQNETKNSRTHYYIEDTTSQATYGEIERVLNFSKIAPIGVSSNARARTANQLYKAASEWLTRHKDPLQKLSVRVMQQRVNFSPGDTVHVEYIERANLQGTPITMKSIDDDFWVMKVEESFGENGENARLELMNIDQWLNDDSDIIVDVVSGVEVQETGYAATYSIWSGGVFHDWIGSVQLPEFDLYISEDVLQIEAVTMVVHTYGSRRHTITTTPEQVGLHNFVEDTSEYPYNMTIKVNGTTVVSGLGDDALDQIVGEEYDITEEILSAGNDGRGDHRITVSTVTNDGLLRIQCLIRGLIVPGKVT